ncbi:MAG: pentapeptide repeat-containing protein [Hyphomicrobium sp.]
MAEAIHPGVRAVVWPPSAARAAAVTLILLAGLAVPVHFGAALAGGASARDFIEALYKFDAASGTRLDYSGRDLQSLDLSEMDFKGAKLAGADVFGTDLTRSSLRGVDLQGARLDRAVITRTDFSGASLAGVSMMRPTIFTTLSSDRRESPVFRAADLSGARLTGNFDGTDFSAARLDRMQFGPHEPRADISFYPRNFCRGCNFADASLAGANLYDASFVRASFVRADFAGANLARTDLSGADLTGANLAGADLSGADLDSTILVGVKGLDSVKGLSLAVNAERALR